MQVSVGDGATMGELRRAIWRMTSVPWTGETRFARCDI
jgi:hypothetical protein